MLFKNVKFRFEFEKDQGIEIERFILAKKKVFLDEFRIPENLERYEGTFQKWIYKYKPIRIMVTCRGIGCWILQLEADGKLQKPIEWDLQKDGFHFDKKYDLRRLK